MALQRNGRTLRRNGNGAPKTNGNKRNLRRNGNGATKQKAEPPSDDVMVLAYTEQSLVYKGRERLLTKTQLYELEKEDRRIVKWLKSLDQAKSFSREWILECLAELALQCMAKRPHAVGDMHTMTFLPKAANNALKTMAEIQGYNVWKFGLGSVGTPLVALDQSGAQVDDSENADRKLLEQDLSSMPEYSDKMAEEMLDILVTNGAFEVEGDIEYTDAEIVE